jgi:hypothetical protein
MVAIQERFETAMNKVFMNPLLSNPLSHGFHLASESASQAESQQSQFTGDWHKRENSEHRDAEEDIRLHELMEDIKRYIRNIDISDL